MRSAGPGQTGTYLWPAQQRLVGVVTVVAITAVDDIGGLSRTVTVTKAVLAVVIVALAAVVATGWSSGEASLDRLTPVAVDAGILHAAGFLFVAFAGSARIATLGEEVRDPGGPSPAPSPLRSRPSCSSTRSSASGCSASSRSARIAGRAPPESRRRDLARGSLVTAVRLGPGVAALGVLLNLVPGVSRAVIAMARPATCRVVRRCRRPPRFDPLQAKPPSQPSLRFSPASSTCAGRSGCPA